VCGRCNGELRLPAPQSGAEVTVLSLNRKPLLRSGINPIWSEGQFQRDRLSNLLGRGDSQKASSS
jgi:hypothetical protein